MTTRQLKQALDYAAKGYPVFPAAEGGKEPAFAGRNWKELLTCDEAQIREWFGTYNIAVGTEFCDVLDFDHGLEAARDFYRKHRDIVTTVLATPHGIHMLFKPSGQPTQKFEHGDWKRWPSYTIGAGSRLADGAYHFLTPLVRPEELKPAPETEPMNTHRVLTRGEVKSVVQYVMQIESMQGQHGSAGLVRACSILRDGGMSEAEAMVALIEWNNSGKACPPWSLAELARACTNTYRKGAQRVR